MPPPSPAAPSCSVTSRTTSLPGITPVNDYVPDRNPCSSIDRGGQICAVGYLIERSVGRGVAEGIAATHRLD